ncbi:hypothetical protein J2S36_001507 [Arcanobacterium hippocoleae]|uniref:SGNH hydrolase-type esterase domain-containing protein n=2 Tax=Arcanobacterium hippocoleae TaxID=149017 RepID=A0ABU1T3U0_9ACTO|nr:GDSL-type esterase/lipase family protein [Arcanobacterium hippocoleae]MDR6939964.1 hypothetical protein [Arcanobacterium hippocoleae]
MQALIAIFFTQLLAASTKVTNEQGKMQYKQIFFVGDELVSTMGDDRALGWVGRVLARTPSNPPILPIPLPFAGENTAALTNRWQGEVEPRLNREYDNRLVIGLGSHDLDAGISAARSRLYLANLLDNAEQLQIPTFVVGPPPRPDRSAREVGMLTKAFAEVCHRRSTIYVDTFSPLINHEQWNTDMSISAQYTPRQAGYGLMAWLVLHCGWHQWLGLPQRNTDY